LTLNQQVYWAYFKLFGIYMCYVEATTLAYMHVFFCFCLWYSSCCICVV